MTNLTTEEAVNLIRNLYKKALIVNVTVLGSDVGHDDMIVFERLVSSHEDWDPSADFASALRAVQNHGGVEVILDKLREG